MKKKVLSYYLDLMKSALVKQDWSKAKHYGEIALKKLPVLIYSPVEEYHLYHYLGFTYRQYSEYSRSLNFYYKANLITTRHHLSPAQNAYTLLLIGLNFMSMNNIDQSLNHFQKVEQYYQKHGDDSLLMNKETRFNNFIFLSECYLSSNNIKKAESIIDGYLSRRAASLSRGIVLGNYYFLKGEYLMKSKKYSQARLSFQECIEVFHEINYPHEMIEAKIYLASLELLEGKTDSSILLLESIIKDARRLKLKDLICKAGLLLSKCYKLKNMLSKSSNIEKSIKHIISSLDIRWFYATTRYFEELYQELQSIYPVSLEAKQVSPILTGAINKHRENSPYKNIIIGQAALMMEIIQLIEKVASTDLPVLIQGETGTGKELIAKALHQCSSRREEYWSALNCGAIQENLMENELFGHDKGAFTDAKDDRKGYIELASKGTLFFDEIADMPPSMQQKLLRIIEEKQIWRVGSEKPIPVNTRFIFASNQNIEEFVRQKRFRLDLFHRINTIVITLPPLRDRKEDIPLLVNYFLGKYSHTSSIAPRFSPDALRLFVDYHWPGNVRELENEIKRICTLYKNTTAITESMLSDAIRSKQSLSSTSPSSLKALRDLAEKNIIMEALKKCNGNIAQTARQLDYPRHHLYRKIRQLNIRLK